jgi:hypothetical protein
MSKRARFTVPTAIVTLALTLTTASAFACGGLVGENGSIKLTRTVTLAAYHKGVERYVTSFEFSGKGESVGSIVPLPGVPTKVERGGSWTLQRLEREIAPPAELQFSARKAAGLATSDAVVILKTKIDALDITVLKGGGKAVGKWATEHGFLLTPDAPEMLDFYARRSPIFMAARFDASRAQLLGQQTGDGTPIMVTIPTKSPWVPLRILSLGLDRSKIVDADVFLLTDNRPKLLAGGPGLQMPRDEQASRQLLSDLRSDKGMQWVPNKMWFTYLKLNVAAAQLDYDLAVSTNPTAVPALADTGVTAAQARPVVVDSGGLALWPIAVALAAGIAVFGFAGLFGRRRPTGAVPA